MGASFEDKTEEEIYHEGNGIGIFSNNNNGRSAKDENIPLVPRKLNRNELE